MIKLTDNFEDLNSYLNNYHIDTSKPGFYDDLNFIRLEQMIPNFLENYASFIIKKNYNQTYLQESEEKITKISNILSNELIKDGRKGACIDLSIVMSRILDLENIWNYPCKGSVTIDFPKASDITRKYFWSIDYGEFKAGHVWIVSPPFKIIDLTIQQQAYKMGEENYIPQIILQKETEITELNLSNLISPEVMSQLTIIERKNNAKILDRINPALKEFYKLFKPEKFTLNSTKFIYTPFGISVSDVALKDITSLELNGMSGIEIYNELIKGKI
ncbi:MAG: hypothetical protein ACN6N7_17110 [Chryseobacterium culicis]